MNTLLLNRDFKLPDDGWFHVIPLGVFNHPSGVVQVIDTKAAESIVNRFNTDKAAPNFPGLLVDFDHFSDSEETPSEAAGWIDELANRDNGVWGHIRWSDSGEAAVKGGRYRLVSPVFNAREAEQIHNAAPKRLRPLKLIKVAITNDPNLKGMVPLSNRSGVPPADSQQNQNQNRTMKTIATRLGLSADASEESVLAEVTKLQNRCDTAEKELTPLKTERDQLLNRITQLDTDQIDADLDARKLPDEKKAKLKPVLAAMKNRAERVAFLDDVIGKPPAKADANAIHNRGARTPAAIENQSADGDADRERAEKANAEVQEYKLANRCSYDQAWNAVRNKKPELFGLAKN